MRWRHVIQRQLRDLTTTLKGNGAEHQGLEQLGAELAQSLAAVGG